MENKDEYINKLLENIPDLDRNINLSPIIKTKADLIKENALDKAWKTRTFEIELYWKRALYFWGFIALAFGALIAVLNFREDLITISWLNRNVVAFLLCITGTVFSYSWYLVNRASKRWQANWETWIDYLEEPIYGKLYQTPINFEEMDKNENKKIYITWNNCGMYSVSKINILISLFITLIWGGLSFIFAFELFERWGFLVTFIFVFIYFLFERYTKSKR